MKKMNVLVLNIIMGIFIGAAIMTLIIRPKITELKSLKRVKEHYNTTYLEKKGGTKLFRGIDKPWLEYDLRSWDAGKNWYAVDYNFDTQELKIVGEAEKIYPGLMEFLDAMDKLTDYVEKNGPINPIDSRGVEVLESAGFKIKNN